jgi:hypothetical protein
MSGVVIRLDWIWWVYGTGIGLRPVAVDGNG